MITMTTKVRLGDQPNTPRRVRVYNAVIRYLMWELGITQKAAQSPRYSMARRRLYNSPTFAPRDI